MEEIKSPLTGKSAHFEGEISVSELVEKYYSKLGIEVGHLFDQKKSIKVYRCTDSGYRFFYPFSVSGDGSFYQMLQNFDWYYMPWKWEHEQAFKFIKPGMHILEIGCAEGEFLAKSRSLLNVTTVGLELNLKALEKARAKGINVLQESVESHSESNSGVYDLVCSFQVLEHISDIKIFLEAQLKLLKPNGKLIISVPNNEGFLGLDDNNMLNFPPHHMGLWDETSLSFLSQVFPISLEHIFFEPLQNYHDTYFWRIAKQKLLSSCPAYIKRPFKRMIDYSFFKKILFKIFSKKFKAFTIQAVYTKKDI